MNYEQSAHTIANSNRGHSDAAVAFAVLHLAAQVQRVADTLDELVDPAPGTPSLHVDVSPR